MYDIIKTNMDRFNERVGADESLQKAVEGKRRRILITVTDGTQYHFELADNTLSGLGEGPIEDADIQVTSDTATYVGIIDRSINPYKAFVEKRIKIRASLPDMFLFQKFMSA